MPCLRQFGCGDHAWLPSIWLNVPYFWVWSTQGPRGTGRYFISSFPILLSEDILCTTWASYLIPSKIQNSLILWLQNKKHRHVKGLNEVVTTISIPQFLIGISSISSYNSKIHPIFITFDLPTPDSLPPNLVNAPNGYGNSPKGFRYDDTGLIGGYYT